MYILSGNKGGITLLASFIEDDKRILISGGGYSIIKLWDIDIYCLICTFGNHTNSISSMCTYFLDGIPYLASGSWDETVNVWNPRKNLFVKICEGHKSNNSH